jgi:Bacteriophage lambda head decoration protein D
MNPNPTTLDVPTGLSNILGAYDEGHWQTEVCEIKAGIGVLARGSILATGTAGDIGKLVKLSAGTEAQSYGVLLDELVDTGVAYSDGSVTGSIAKAGSFKGSALIVPAGVDAGLVSVALRGRGIFVEGAIPVPAAAALLEGQEQLPAETEYGRSRSPWDMSRESSRHPPDCLDPLLAALKPRARIALVTFLRAGRYGDMVPKRERRHARGSANQMRNALRI